MSDAAQGVLMLVVFFTAVVVVGWVMRGRLTDIATTVRLGDDEVEVPHELDERVPERRAA